MLNYQPVVSRCDAPLKKQGLAVAESKNLRSVSFIVLRWTGVWDCETHGRSSGATYQDTAANLHTYLQPSTFCDGSSNGDARPHLDSYTGHPDADRRPGTDCYQHYQCHAFFHGKDCASQPHTTTYGHAPADAERYAQP
jgi:hypothetical protein